MAKPVKRVSSKDIQRNATASHKSKQTLIPEKYHDSIYIFFLILSIYIFFSGPIFGGGFHVSDNIASNSFVPYLNEAKESGNFPLWLPYIFCGLPGYAALLVTGERLWDFIPQIIFSSTEFVGAVFSSDLARVLCFYAFYAVGMYILMRFKKHSRFVAFFTAFAAVFSTQIILWVMIGHNTKPIVFAMFPYVFLLIERLREKFSLMYAALLIFVVHFMFSGSHIQMIFYGICAFALYMLFELVSRLISKKEPLSVVKVAVLLLVAGGMAFLMSADRYLATMEYTPYSTRGSAPIVNQDKNQDASGGNTYEYATMWSFSPQETMTFFVPNYFGFGQLKYKGELTGNKEVKLPSYWGPKEFEDAPPYMGIIVIGLAILGLILFRRDIFVQFLIALSLFALFLSFGKNLPILYDIFYNLVPSFNKFRAPSMALALVQFAVPILAGYGLTGIFEWRKKVPENHKRLFWFTVLTPAAFLILGLLFMAMFKSVYLEAVSSSEMLMRFASNYGDMAAEEIRKFVWSEMTSDWLMTGFIAVIAGLLFFLFVRNKMKSAFVFSLSLFFLLALDLWRVGYRPMDYDEKKQDWQDVNFRRTDLVDYLQNDKSIYRIADFASLSPNLPAYFKLENVGGYHSAKLRVYQDIMDVVESGSTSNITSPLLWNLMNVKYIITNQPLGEGIQPAFQSQQTGQYVYFNSGMLERAFFVDTVIVAEKPIDILNIMKNKEFDPAKIAYVEKKLPLQVNAPTDEAYIKIQEKRNEYIKIEALASGNNLMFISEIYYPPGWKAYIDGKEAEIYKTNYAFRSIIVPEGKHIIEFKFYSEKFEMGKSISLAANIATLLVLVAGVFFEIRRRKTIVKNEVEAKNA